MNIVKWLYAIIPLTIIGWFVPKIVGVILYAEDTIFSFLILGLSSVVSHWVVAYCLSLLVIYFGLLVYKMVHHFGSNF